MELWYNDEPEKHGITEPTELYASIVSYDGYGGRSGSIEKVTYDGRGKWTYGWVPYGAEVQWDAGRGGARVVAWSRGEEEDSTETVKIELTKQEAMEVLDGLVSRKNYLEDVISRFKENDKDAEAFEACLENCTAIFYKISNRILDDGNAIDGGAGGGS